MSFRCCCILCAPVTIIIINYGGFTVRLRNYFRAVIRWLRSDFSLTVLFWLAGLLLGTFVFKPDLSLMHPQFPNRVSIVSAIVTATFPFLLAALAVRINCKKLLWIICFLKAFSFAYCGALIWHTYGSAGWLIRFLLMFTDICTLPAFFWCCIRCSKKDFLVSLLFAVSAACINYSVISPFLAKIIML